MSSLAQDELGHAQALYQLLAAAARRRPRRRRDRLRPSPDEYRHARLLDHGRGDWAMTIARRYLYDTADTVRLDALAASSFGPLRELVDKIRREERYHVMHATAWFERLADARGRAPQPPARRARGAGRGCRDRLHAARGRGGPRRGRRDRGADGGHRGALAGADHADVRRPRAADAAAARRSAADGRATASRSAGCGASSPLVRREDPVAAW